MAKTQDTDSKLLKRPFRSDGHGRSIGTADVNIGTCVPDGKVLRLILDDKVWGCAF